ncbi:MAG: PRC-barrel domain-containing protein [Candidatus Dormiibacterota bacterium]
MTEETPFTIGAKATCADGPCGEVIRVVVDPVAMAITHLVVEPKHRKGLGRLVPLDLLEETEGGMIQIHCTLSEFEALESAEETEFRPEPGGYAGYGADEARSWPYYRLGLTGYGGLTLGYAREGLERPERWSESRIAASRDTIPRGEVAFRRGEHVHATDGDIGQVHGLAVDPRTHRATHVLLQEGHLFGRKEVAIPITAVVGIGDGIRLNLTKEEVQNLPPVDVDRPGGND